MPPKRVHVKGLVDSGIKKIPNIFIRPSDDDQLNQKPYRQDQTNIQIPVINLHADPKEVVDKIMIASKEWGFFQVVNHEVPLSVLDEMIKGVIRFNEQDNEAKKEYYTRDRAKRVRYNSNFDLYETKSATWRDTLTVHMSRSDPMNPQELPAACRVITMEYTKHVTILGDTLFELLSEGLGLKPDHLKQLNSCPEPERTLGIVAHTDIVFLTILIQNEIGGLQVLHKDRWVDVYPDSGALIINIGDILQISSNDILKSVKHRVLANRAGPRISVGCFLTPRSDVEDKFHGPIKELISDDSAPIYRQFTYKEYVDNYVAEIVV
ncbi:hypothetical protein AQUCO_03400365v1 [Aquilegia coerulea]|uniref:Fe2OG dioxygenase domain-containing protein n=1 Tax=Aquilegia coerulea TaxID=218851 RepID=A0A2G5CYU2_AQUCA|nr:hypothetical protein AQUCO_03400365v1 [Aquilegia coerulea]